VTVTAKFCRKCGVPLDEDVEFCPKCGAESIVTPSLQPKRERHQMHWLAIGLIMILIGIVFFLSQTITMPTQMWVAYSVAGLGAVFVITGLASYIGESSPGVKAYISRSKTIQEQPRKAGFSGQIGMDHSALVGRKILFEFDPSMSYQTVLRAFALECASNKEEVLVLTPHGSVIEQAFSADDRVKIIHLTHDLMLSTILDDHQVRPLNIVYDSLTDIALSSDSRTSYKFALNALQQLSDTKITAIFLLNPSAHEPKDVNSLRGLFSNQIIHGKEGIRSLKLA
jgi:hypothetical protein